jgi:Flp pilus assembly protein CpaB
VAAPKRSNNLLILIGVVFLVVGTGLVIVLLRSSGSSSNNNGSPAADGTVPVLVTKRAISKGTLGRDMNDAVEVKQVPAVTRPSDALTTPGELTERTAIADIGAGQPLRAAFFRERTASAGVIKIPDGKQALAVTVPFVPAGAGYVGQGDFVNVYAVLTTKGEAVVPKCSRLCDAPAANTPQSAARLVLSNIQVLDVSQEVAPAAAAAPGDTTANTTLAARGSTAAPTVTYLLALDANQAERMVFFTSYADLYLSLVPKDQPASTTSGHDQLNALKP